MTGYLIESDAMFAGQSLSMNCMLLSLEQISQAEALSALAASESQQWQTYLTGLALFGVEQWLQERAPDLPLHSDGLQRPTDLNSATMLPRLRIGEFKLHLVAVDDLQDNYIPVPTAAIEQPEIVPHFYLIVEVLEEVGQACIYGYLRQDDLRRQITQLPQEGSATYLVPLDWIDPDPDTLLLYLRCLEPSAIPLPAVSATPSLSQRAINVGLWLQEQLDTVAQELSWVLLPPLSVSSAMRGILSVTEEFEAMLADLVERQVIDIPPDARGAYQDLEWETLSLRLYAAAWSLSIEEENSEPEWALLLLLGTPTGMPLPAGIQLQVRDAAQLLEDVVLQNSQSYLYAQVIGAPNEAFWVTINLPDGNSTTLCPFTFRNELP
jgi:hypothetical protein